MSIFSAIPAPVRKAVRAVVPAPVVDRAKDYVMRRYYVPGMVSRSGPAEFAFRRYVLRQPPHLHRLLFHVTDHCNLNCKGCTHFSNIAEKSFADPEAYQRQMIRLTKVFSGITEIFLLGGEPLLHPRMASFIDITRESFPQVAHQCDDQRTPGSQDAGRVLGVDAPKRRLAPVRRLPGWSREGRDRGDRAARGCQVEWTDPREEFFKLPIDLAGEQDPADSFRQCRGVMNCPVLRDGRIYPCAYAAFIDIFERKFDVDGIGAGE